MSEQNVVGRYDDTSQAEEAIRSLAQGGFSIKQVSVIVQNLESEKKVAGFVTIADLVKKWAGIGAWVGALLGLLIGVAIIWIPGFTGLSTTEARQRLAEVGPNLLETKEKLTVLGLFLNQFKSPIVLILLFATIVSAVVGDCFCQRRLELQPGVQCGQRSGKTAGSGKD